MPRYRNGTHIHKKGYPRVSAGPLRGQLVHRVVAAALIGRDLDESEEVHHRDSDRRNFHWSNLVIMGQSDHGWVSARQAWYMREKDKREKLEWDKYMAEVAETFVEEVTAAKADGVAWPGPVDGSVREGWEQRETANGKL